MVIPNTYLLNKIIIVIKYLETWKILKISSKYSNTDLHYNRMVVITA